MKKTLLLLGTALLALWFLSSSLSAHGYARLAKAFQTIPTRTPTSQANPTQQPSDQPTSTITPATTIVPGAATSSGSSTVNPTLTATTTAASEGQQTDPTDEISTTLEATETQVGGQDSGSQPTEESPQHQCEQPPCETEALSRDPTSQGSENITLPQNGPPDPPTPVTGSLIGQSQPGLQRTDNGGGLGSTWLLLVGIGLLAIGAFGLVVERRRR